MLRYCSRGVPFLICMIATALTVSACRAEVAESRSGSTSQLPDAAALRMELVREIKAFEAELGWTPTTNFLTYAHTLNSYPYCAYTETFSFELNWSVTDSATCVRLRPAYDSVHYEFEALAHSNTPLSRSMVEAPLARFIMVVLHEDFHEQIAGSERHIDESATSLVGYLAAREFARRKFGAESAEYATLARDLELAYHDALIERKYFERLHDVYERYARGRLSDNDALLAKRELFRDLRSECVALGAMATAMSCTAITNNAIFANSFAYAAHYPLFYRLASACNFDPRRTSLTIRAIVSTTPRERDVVAQIEAEIGGGCTGKK